MPRRIHTLLFVSLTAACALIVSAAPRLDVALSRQYELATERPNDASVQNDLGNLLLLAEQDAAAEQAYRKALEIDGSHKGARFNLGLLLQAQGAHQDAIEQFSTLLELDPAYAWAHYQIGVSLQETGRRKAAVDHYARAFGLDPTLSFAENNPHIIDNHSVTEALLLASRYGKPATRTVARQYDDAERIAQLMLEPSGENVVVADGEPEADAANVQASESDSAGRQTSTERALDARLEAETSSAPVITEQSTGADDNEEQRVITEEDLDGTTVVGGAVADPADARPTTRTRVDVRRPTRRDDGRAVGGANQAPPSNLGSQRYRPARRSSASLELKLLPEEPAEQLASAAPRRGL